MVAFRGFWCLLVLPLVLAGVTETSAGPATERLQRFFAAANRVIADPATDDDARARLAAVRRLTQDIGDWETAAARALGAEWTSRTRAEQREFARLFADLLPRMFVTVLAGKVRVDGGVGVTWLGERVEAGEVFVATIMEARSGHELAVEYRMASAGGDWRVRDVVVEGVSLVENYRAQFLAILRRSSYAGLVAEMRHRVPDGLAVATAPVPLPAAPSARSGAQGMLAMAPTRPDSGPPSPAVLVPPRADAAGAGVERAVRPLPGPKALATVEPAALPPVSVAAAPSGTPPVALPTVSPATIVTRETTPSSRAYWVQVGAFRSVDAAARLTERLRSWALTIATDPLTRGLGAPRDVLARVLVGPFAQRADAAAALRRLRASGVPGVISEDR